MPRSFQREKPLRRFFLRELADTEENRKRKAAVWKSAKRFSTARPSRDFVQGRTFLTVGG